MDHFVYWFSTFRWRKNKWRKYIDLKFEFFCKMHHWSNSVLLPLLSPVGRFQMPFEGLSLVTTFGIIYTANPVLQNMTKTFCVRWLTFDIFKYNPLQTMLNYVRHFFQITSFPRNEVGDSRFFFAFLAQVTHYLSDSNKTLEKGSMDCMENFRANVPKLLPNILCLSWDSR